MHLSEDWEEQTLNELYIIHEALTEQLMEVQRAIRTFYTRTKADILESYEGLCVRRQDILQHLAYLERVIPIRHVEEEERKRKLAEEAAKQAAA